MAVFEVLDSNCSDSEYPSSEESEKDREVGQPPPKKHKVTKFTGAFRYKTRFSQEWKELWPFVLAVPGNPHSFRCNVCSKILSCAHQGAADVKDHTATKTHQYLARSLATQPKLSFRSSSDQFRDKVRC